MLSSLPPPVLRIVAPSGAMESFDILPKALKRLNRMGFNTQIDAQANLVYQRFAGQDHERAKALEQALLDPSIHIVMAARGGYGAHRILPLIDWNLAAQAVLTHKTYMVGHSDITAIHLALLRHGAPSIAGPCAGVDFGGDSCNAFMKKSLLAALNINTNTPTPTQTNIHFKTHAKQAPFSAQGILWGGNLAMLCSLLGTPYFPTLEQIRNGILFIEDTNERPFRVERMLNQLHMAGILSTQSAVLWGDFGAPAVLPYDRGYDLNSVIDYAKTTLGLGNRLITGLPFGHCPKKLSLPVGVQTALTVNNNAMVTLQFAPI